MVDGPTGLALVTVDADGENSIVVVPGANARVDGAHVDAHRALVAAAAVVVVQGEIPRAGIERAAAVARGRLVLNLAPVVDVAPDTLRRADPLVVNEHEARLVLAALDGADQAGPARTDEDGPARTDEDAVAARLVAHGVRSVVITLGARGALVRSGGGDTDGRGVTVPAPRVTVVDTTGAGDAFVGALAARLAAGDDLLAATRLAVRAGAAAVRGPGAQASLPGAQDVLPD